MIRISEIFQSRQGEGILTGTESIFIRTSGCNLACRFCDTRYASVEAEGNYYRVEEIISEILKPAYKAVHVVVTGGEPFIQPDIVELCCELHRLNKHITIETAGTVYKPVYCDLMSISPKMSNSTPQSAQKRTHENTRFNPAVINQLTSQYDYQIKFVVKTLEDTQETADYLALFPQLDKSKVLYMPEGISLEELTAVESWLIPWTKENGFRYCPRKQIQWYGNRRGT